MIAAPAATAGRIDPAQFRSIDLGGLRLGMTLPAVEAFMRARDDLNPPSASYTDEVDCDYLASDASGSDSNVHATPQTVESYSFQVANYGFYSVHFYQLPSATVADTIEYREHRATRDWAYYLAEAELRYGKADYVYKGRTPYDGIEAGWCERGATECSHDLYNDRLTLTYYSHTADQVEPGDGLDWRLDAPDQLLRKREDDETELARSKTAAGRRLLARCRARAAALPGEDAQNRYVLALIGDGMANSPPIMDSKKVPATVFAALGIDPRQYRRGSCFMSNDVLIDDPDCKSYYAVSFRWARRMGASWVVATRTGGGTLRDQFYVVRPQKSGRFKKVWWSETLTSLSAWRKAGARPMIAPKAPR
ncbi:MAG TPA: hypothetical protein VN137_08305 [Sphingomonas sp.]|nr:hypothetical protein [Sphingomonas sp.]